MRLNTANPPVCQAVFSRFCGRSVGKYSGPARVSAITILKWMLVPGRFQERSEVQKI
jgi:hypothetical protein